MYLDARFVQFVSGATRVDGEWWETAVQAQPQLGMRRLFARRRTKWRPTAAIMAKE